MRLYKWSKPTEQQQKHHHQQRSGEASIFVHFLRSTNCYTNYMINRNYDNQHRRCCSSTSWNGWKFYDFFLGFRCDEEHCFGSEILLLVDWWCHMRPPGFLGIPKNFKRGRSIRLRAYIFFIAESCLSGRKISWRFTFYVGGLTSLSVALSLFLQCVTSECCQFDIYYKCHYYTSNDNMTLAGNNKNNVCCIL